MRPRNNTNFWDEKLNFSFSLSLISGFHSLYCNHDKMAATRASYEKGMPSATTNINR